MASAIWRVERPSSADSASRMLWSLRPWLEAFEIDAGKRKVKPCDATMGQPIAAMLRPSMGDQIPSGTEEIDRAFGSGW